MEREREREGKISYGDGRGGKETRTHQLFSDPSSKPPARPIGGARYRLTTSSASKDVACTSRTALKSGRTMRVSLWPSWEEEMKEEARIELVRGKRVSAANTGRERDGGRVRTASRKAQRPPEELQRTGKRQAVPPFLSSLLLLRRIASSTASKRVQVADRSQRTARMPPG